MVARQGGGMPIVENEYQTLLSKHLRVQRSVDRVLFAEAEE